MNIREQTVLIIRKGNQYIQTESAVIGGTIWSTGAYDALRTRSISNAIRIAKNVGGEICLFNPVTGQLRLADMDKLIKMEEDRNDREVLQRG